MFTIHYDKYISASDLIDELDYRFADVFAVYHVSIGKGKVLHAFDDYVDSFDLDVQHLHEHLHLVVRFLIEIQNSFHLNASRDDLTEVSDSHLVTPTVVGGCGSAHDYF